MVSEAQLIWCHPRHPGQVAADLVNGEAALAPVNGEAISRPCMPEAAGHYMHCFM